MIPTGIFEVEIQPLIAGDIPIKATVKPILVDMEAGSGITQLITGYEVISTNRSGACHISELDWLIESGQYKVLCPAVETRHILKANHNKKGNTKASAIVLS